MKKRISIQAMIGRNFKGLKEIEIKEFGKVLNVYGDNGTGKTTLFDLFCWVTFDQDSMGVHSFGIRPMLADGSMVDNVDIYGEIKLRIDSDEGTEDITLAKTQKQKWVKKRGSDAPTFQGNENAYEINGFPVSEREYKEKIESIISEKIFRMVTNPMAFAGLKWQEQRKMLMQMVPEVTDETILSEDPDKYEAVAEDIRLGGIEKAMDKAKKAMAKLKDRAKEIPARIDEASRSIVADVPSADELDAKKATAEKALADIKSKRADTSSAFSAVSELQDKVMKARFELKEMEQKEDIRVHEAYLASQREYEKLRDISYSLFDKKQAISDNKARLEKQYDELKDELSLIRQELSVVRDEHIDENAIVCPTCKQELPEDQRKAVIESFRDSKRKRIDGIIAKGNAVHDKAVEVMARMEGLTRQLADVEDEWTKATQKSGQAYEAMNNMPQKADYGTLDGYQEKVAEINVMNLRLNSINKADDIYRQIDAEEAAVHAEQREIEIMRGTLAVNAQAEARIAELTEQQSETTQLVAEQEEKIYLLEEFSKHKMSKISDSINSLFEIVDFKLFNIQINGAVKETCEMTINGVPYSDINSAGKVQGGLDVIRAISDMYGVSAPIWIDNRESTVWIPDMDAQIINLYVDGKEPMLVWYAEKGE